MGGNSSKSSKSSNNTNQPIRTEPKIGDDFVEIVEIYGTVLKNSNNINNPKWAEFIKKYENTVGSSIKPFKARIDVIKDKKKEAMTTTSYNQLNQKMQEGLEKTYDYIINEMTDIYNFIFWMVLVATKIQEIVTYVAKSSNETVEKLLAGIKFLETTSVKVGMLGGEGETKLNELKVKLKLVIGQFDALAAYAKTTTD